MKSIIFSFILVLLSSASSFAASVSGKVDQVFLNVGDDSSIYFTLKAMPSDGTKSFLVRSNSSSNPECSNTLSSDSLNRIYSMILSAKLSEKDIEFSYCLSATYHGLIGPAIYLK
ncbi:MAG: hypothetical protein ACI8SR_000511 [Oceanicoccus sp.]